ncbi:TetR/AcrR family transcriptional regulator [Cupriavidus metallidurans]|jgi:TetR/AcrR family transcriptional regulator, ethionamide resistance regulator|uniref:TetR/AcrR family transcriptional regulator n=1 Tax=Cupriavidus metallidurans TaxID=119219 RepID=A0A482J0Q6_9BURK|nr:TetR/AcrR family transcriptional regulator [Cupriavidus metallidurans]QBP13493.1 TetR/AcrR family transcriptional regulator [Cupriavidus metallidurans]
MTAIEKGFAAVGEPWEASDHRQRVAAKRRQRMRSLLLSSALRLLVENRTPSPSIDDIICAAQVSRGTFYKYFPSSEAIMRELIGRVAEQWVKVADPIVRSHDDPAEHISRGIRLASMLAVHQPGVAGILGRFGWSGYQAPSMLEFVRRDIEDGVRRNRFTRMPITLAFNIVTGAAMSAMHRMLETECRDDFSELAAAVALRALGVESATANAISTSPLIADIMLFRDMLGQTLSDAP